jgi:hypothetical protein
MLSTWAPAFCLTLSATEQMFIHFQAVAVQSEGQFLILDREGDTWPLPSAEAVISKIQYIHSQYSCSSLRGS